MIVVDPVDLSLFEFYADNEKKDTNSTREIIEFEQKELHYVLLNKILEFIKDIS